MPGEFEPQSLTVRTWYGKEGFANSYFVVINSLFTRRMISIKMKTERRVSGRRKIKEICLE
jgi:hypothetical protein